MGSILGSVVKIGSSIIGGSKKKKASKKAQAALEAGYSNSISAANSGLDKIEGLYQPYVEAGKTGLNSLMSGYTSGKYTTPFTGQDLYIDPSYKFRVDQGIKALDRSAAARGNLFSGAQLQGVNDYGQQAASQEYQAAYDRYNQDQTNDWNRTYSLASLGYSTAGNLTNAISANTDQQIDAQLGLAGAQATGARERGAIAANTWENAGNEVSSALGKVKLSDLTSLFG